MSARPGVTAVVAATFVVAAAAGCGGDEPSATASSARTTITTATTTTPEKQPPAKRIRTRAVAGVRMIREPIVIPDQNGYWAYVRTNKALPVVRGTRVRAVIEVAGAGSGVLIQHHDRCYWQNDDLPRLSTPRPRDVPYGTRLPVRLYIEGQDRPITASGPLRRTLPPFVVEPGNPPLEDDHEPYLRLLGCSRHPDAGDRG